MQATVHYRLYGSLLNDMLSITKQIIIHYWRMCKPYNSKEPEPPFTSAINKLQIVKTYSGMSDLSLACTIVQNFEFYVHTYMQSWCFVSHPSRRNAGWQIHGLLSYITFKMLFTYQWKRKWLTAKLKTKKISL